MQMILLGKWVQHSLQQSSVWPHAFTTQFDAITTEPQRETLDTIGELSANLVDSLEKLKDVISANEKIIEDHRKNSEKQIDVF